MYQILSNLNFYFEPKGTGLGFIHKARRHVIFQRHVCTEARLARKARNIGPGLCK